MNKVWLVEIPAKGIRREFTHHLGMEIRYQREPADAMLKELIMEGAFPGMYIEDEFPNYKDEALESWYSELKPRGLDPDRFGTLHVYTMIVTKDDSKQFEYYYITSEDETMIIYSDWDKTFGIFRRVQAERYIEVYKGNAIWF